MHLRRWDFHIGWPGPRPAFERLRLILGRFRRIFDQLLSALPAEAVCLVTNRATRALLWAYELLAIRPTELISWTRDARAARARETCWLYGCRWCYELVIPGMAWA